MNLLITDITQLLTIKGDKKPRIGKELSELGIIKNAAIYIEDGKIKYYGKEKDVIEKIKRKRFKEIKAGGVVMPAFVDSHTHTAFAKPRLKDFELRTKGLSYQEIKKLGGGINQSARDIREITEEKLTENILWFLSKFASCGTATLEIKSGYGLNFENEIKILNAIKRAKEKTELEIIPTFLGAHSVPAGFSDTKSYLDYLKKELIPYVSKNKLAEYVDIFCEKGYFSVDEAIDYLSYAKKYGLKPKIHAEQLSRYGGSIVAYKIKAVSADHMDWADKDYLNLLKKSKTVVTFLPASNYFLGLLKYPDAREFIENGNIVSLATDFNPGTSPAWNMQFVISIALTHMKMKIEQAIVASTYNAAYAVEKHKNKGMINIGFDADLIILEVKDYRELGYYFGDNLNRITIKKGKVIYEKNCTF